MIVRTLKNDIYIGSVNSPAYHYSNRSIVLNSLNGVFSVDTIGNELSIDTFSFEIRYDFDADLIYAPRGKDGYLDTNDKLYRLRKSGTPFYYDFIPKNSDKLIDTNSNVFRVFGGYTAGDYLLGLPYGTPVYWYVGNSFFVKGYTKQVERVARYAWKVTCISGVGLLDSKNHAGGLYNGVSFLTIARSIIGNSFSFTCDTEISDTLVYGHLPYDTARKNLHRLLFAVGAVMVRGTAGNDYVIKPLDVATVSVSDDRIALGGSIKVSLPADRVEVTEHSFYQMGTDETVTLFDNSNGQNVAENTTVVFKEPMHDLAVTGTLTIKSSHVNYAVVSGVGVLTGKQYTHNETVITQGTGTTNVKAVKDNRLVSFANSNNVARRVYAFYSSARTLKAKILLQNEKVGNNLAILDAFGEPSTAYLEKMTVSVTSVIGATCELVENYTPVGGRNFENRVFVSANGTWTVPSGINLVRIILIGGGTGGYGGYDGANGTSESEMTQDPEYVEPGSGYAKGYVEQRIPAGGVGGAAGEPGRYAIYDKTVNAGEVISFSIGAGGAGGSRNGGAGSAGGDTTASSTSIGSISSAVGISSDTGYFDTLGGQVYAKANVAGYKGGDGGRTDEDSLAGIGGYKGLNGESVAGWNGGAGSNGMMRHMGSSSYTYTSRASGAGGGGAAYGANGSPGTPAFFVARHMYEEDWTDEYYVGDRMYSGRGGNGANASAPAQASYGDGGQGGNGGGGGGNLGGVSGWDGGYTDSPMVVVSWDTDKGGYAAPTAQGGQGSVGGQGGNGCAIIYY